MSAEAKAGHERAQKAGGPREGPAEVPISVTLEGVPIELVVTAARGKLMLEVDEEGGGKLEAASFRVDEGPWDPLDRVGGRWRRVFKTDELAPGEHEIEVMAAEPGGERRKVAGKFRIRTSGP